LVRTASVSSACAPQKLSWSWMFSRVSSRLPSSASTAAMKSLSASGISFFTWWTWAITWLFIKSAMRSFYAVSFSSLPISLKSCIDFCSALTVLIVVCPPSGVFFLDLSASSFCFFLSYLTAGSTGSGSTSSPDAIFFYLSFAFASFFSLRASFRYALMSLFLSYSLSLPLPPFPFFEPSLPSLGLSFLSESMPPDASLFSSLALAFYSNFFNVSLISS